MPTKPALFLDFDGLQFDTHIAISEYMNNRFGISSVPSDFDHSPWLEELIKRYDPGFNLSRDEVYKIFGDEFLTSDEFHEAVKPMPDMPEVVQELARKYRVYTVTARQSHGLDVVVRVTQKHIPNCITGFHCVWQYSDGTFVRRSKKDFMLNFGRQGVAFIDDNPFEIIDAQDHIDSFLFDPKQINDHWDVQNRVRSWREIGKLLL